jgi:hypothetical protein
MDTNQITSILHQNFNCDNCHFVCCKKGDWNRHISTVKHMRLTNPNNITSKNIKSYECNCGKSYKHKSSLSLHKKTCSDKKDLENKELSEPTEKELILLLLKDNKALQELVIEQSKNMMEICKNGTNNTTNTNSNNNITNKTFNLQFFLNEECKDALNISEFVSSIKMDLDDLEKTGLLGYVEGISNIINKNLNDLDETRRPIHCSDVKREVLYIKNDDQWIKENGTNKPVLTKAIKQVAHENIRQISEWRKKHPDCTDPDSKKNDLYLNIVSNAMSGITSEEQLKNYEKIISNVAKEVTIDKA